MVATSPFPGFEALAALALVGLPLAVFAILRLQPDHLVDRDAGDGGYTRRVALVVYDGVELLDLAGPGEVFEVAGGIAADRGRPAFRVVVVAPSAGPVTSQGFLRIVPERPIADVPGAEIVVLPGGSAAGLGGDPAFLEWLGRVGSEAEVALSVCTGAFPLAASGLLDGREATTWHGRTERLRRMHPEVEVVTGRRFVDAGRVVTTAGVSAGIDGALHVVARLSGLDVALRTAEYMEYRWAPEPDRGQAYPRWNPSTDDAGRAVQEAVRRCEDGEAAQAAGMLEEVVRRDAGHAEAWLHLARARRRAGDLANALVAADRAAAFDRTRAVALHDRACIRAASGDLAGAAEDVRLVRDDGRIDPEEFRDDPDLARVAR